MMKLMNKKSFDKYFDVSLNLDKKILRSSDLEIDIC